MKNSILYVLVVVFLISAGLSSCQKEDNTIAEQVSENEQMLEIAKYLCENNNQSSYKNGSGNGAVFIVPASSGLSWGVSRDLVFDPVLGLTGELANASASYGTNDFWRQNPDGSVSLHLVSDVASLSYDNFTEGSSYSGYGNASFHYTGFLDTINLPFPPFQLIILPNDATLRAVSIHGNGFVSEVVTGERKKLDLKIINNPGGQSNVTLSIK